MNNKYGSGVQSRSSMYSSIKCPHCSRMFSDGAALRHIPICTNIIAKPKTLEEKKCKFDT